MRNTPSPRTIARNTFAAFELLLVWLVINESIQPIFIVSGIPVAIIALVLANKVTHSDYASSVSLGPFGLLRYLLLMVKEIAIAAWGMAWVIIRGDDEMHYFEYFSALDDDLLLFLLANSITLTPGSVSVERDGNRILVLGVGDMDDALVACRRLEASITRIGKGRIA
jgi:multicomponent Na+:H+ antiporter subunit E